FTFHKDGRLVWQLPSVKAGPNPAEKLAALRERLRHLYGDEQKLLAVDFSSELPVPFEVESAGIPEEMRANPQFRLWGVIGAPGVARATREDQHVFVNRRPVENRGLNYALLEGYHTSLMKGRYPVCCLFLEIDPSSVDVNIHPAKREIKFHREMDVRRLVAQAVRDTLLSFHGGGQASLTAQPQSLPARPATVRAVEAKTASGVAPASSQPIQATLPEVAPLITASPKTLVPSQPALPIGFRR